MSSDKYTISIRGLGKRYLMPHRRGHALRAHLREFFPAFSGQREDDYLWALRDLDLDVKRGEILGIIGHNGSGKSTLLKILSRVTQPTVGRAVLRGRIGSLLEVGTGFHPDFTGRENVFMAGTLLGLRKREIKARFDAIVDFSGIERFIDMPVKRYSSGMYVRLAYAVASMLDSDILILDEVLSVGDAAFREKSQQNIEKLAQDGRTVLLVSHNSRAVGSICQAAIILDGGRCVFQGNARDAISNYMRSVHGLVKDVAPQVEDSGFRTVESGHWLINERSVLRWISLHAADGTETNKFRTAESMLVRIGYEDAVARNPYFSVMLSNDFGERVATFHSTHAGHLRSLPRSGVVECHIPQLLLGTGTYSVMIDFGDYPGGNIANCIECVSNIIRVQVELNDYVGGIGTDCYQGLVQQTRWRTLTTESNLPPASTLDRKMQDRPTPE